MQPTTQQISATSDLMQNYRLGRAFIPGNRVAAAFNTATGSSEIFTTDSGGNLINVIADKSSSSGWSSADLGFKTKVFDAVDQPDGSILVCALDGTGAIQSNIKTSTGWRGWQAWASGLSDHIPNAYTFKSIIDLKLYRPYDDNGYGIASVFLSALCQFDSNGTALRIPFRYNADQTSWYPSEYDYDSVDWCPALVPRENEMVIDGGVFTFGNLPPMDVTILDPPPGHNVPMQTGNGIQENQVPQAGGWYGNQIPMETATFRYIDPTGTYSGLAAVPGWTAAWKGNKGALSELFALRTGAQGGGTFAFHLYFDTTTSMISAERLGDVQVSSIAPRTMNPGGPSSRIELFAVGLDNHLYHVRQADDNRNNWTPFLGLEQDVAFQHVTAGRDPGMYSEAFAVSRDGKLYHVWQGSVDDTWHFDPVELADSTARIEEISTYTLQLTVFDPQGVPQTDQTVMIYSDSPALLDINGFTCMVRPGLPWTTKTLANGQVTIAAQVESLGAPLLSAWTTGMPANDRIVLEASGPLRDRLATVDQNALLSAKVTDDKGNQTSLLTGNAIAAAPDLANVVKQSMAMAANVAPKSSAPWNRMYFHRSNDHRVTSYVAGFANRTAGSPIGLESVRSSASWPGGGGWQVDFSSGVPVYSALNGPALVSARAEDSVLPSLDETGLSTDWGSIWDYITAGVATLVKWTVDKLSVVFHLIIDGIKYVYNATVSLVSQAFDLLEEVFRAVLVAFQPLFRWLGHVFGWSDILRTQAAIVHSWDQMRQFAIALIARIETIAQPGGPIDNAKTAVHNQFENWISAVLPANSTISSFTNVGASVPPESEIKLNQCSAVNVFLSGMLHADQAGPLPAFVNFSPALPAEAQAALDNFTQQLTTLSTGWESSDAFQNALAYFEKIQDKPDQILGFMAAGLLEIAEGLALLGLEAAQGLILAFTAAARTALDVIWTLLTQPLPIPFVSTLYGFATATDAKPNGDPLTLLNLFSICLAAPATLLYKLAVGNAPYPDNGSSNAPFPTDESLAAFKTAFTSDRLLQLGGLAPQNAAALAADDGDLKAWQKVFQVMATVDLGMFTVLDCYVDLKGEESPMWANAMTLGHQWLSEAFTTPWMDGKQHIPEKDFPTLFWCLKLIPAVLDTIMLQFSGRVLKVAMSAVGPIAHTVTGAANLAGTIYCAVVQQNATLSAQNILGAIPNIGKFVLMPQFRKTVPGAVAIFVLLVLDVVCDIAATGLSVVPIFSGSDSPAVGRSAELTAHA